jgi:FkbM family methyltransferase
MRKHPEIFYRGPVGVVAQPFVRALRGHGLTRHKVIWKAHRLVWRGTKSNRVLVAGFDLELDLHDSLALARGWYEPEETAWYKANVRPGDTVIEVGGNIGFFSLLFSRLVGPEGEVIVYEPDPMLNQILERNLERNGATNVTLRKAAVADRPGTATFYRARKNYGDNRLFVNEGEDATAFDVELVTLDDELAGRDRPVDMVKMDIQGAEPLALEGMAATMAAHPPRKMLLEFWPHGLVGMQRDPRAFIELLRGAGYHVAEIGTDHEVDTDSLLVRLTPENLDWVNLMVTRPGDA